MKLYCHLLILLIWTTAVECYHGGWHDYKDNVFDKFGRCESTPCAGRTRAVTRNQDAGKTGEDGKDGEGGNDGEADKPEEPEEVVEGECCYFDEGNLLNGWFCMTKEQKNGRWFGNYTDFEGTQWSWLCSVPPPPPPPPPKY